MIELEIKGRPQPWAAPRLSGRRMYDIRDAYKKTSRMQIRAQYKGPIIEEAVMLAFFFYLPIPKSTSTKKADQILKDKIWHIVRPDVSNLCKAMEDCLKGIVIKDDAQVVKIISAKEYCSNPRTIIVVTPMSKLISSKL